MKTKQDDWEYSRATTWALFFSVILLFTFIFLPWIGVRPSQNAARLLADNLYGTAGAIQAPFIWIIPLAALAGTSLAIWGVLNAEHASKGSATALLAGAAVITYYLLNQHWAVLKVPKYGPGIGFWVGLGAGLGMLLQIVLAVPFVNRLLDNLGPKPGTTGKGFKFPPKWIPYLFLVPPLTLYLVWIIAPTIYTLYLSLTRWDAVSNPVFIGFANYVQLWKDSDFSLSLLNNLRWLLVFISIPTLLGLMMAMVFNNEMRGGRFFKVSFYAPLVLSFPVIGLIWCWAYNPDMGLINNLLSVFKVPYSAQPGWLGDRALAIWCIIAAAVWRQVGYVMVLYLAGLKNIDPSLLDAAQVDGAGRWNLFRYIIFPLLAPVTTIIVVISVIDSLRAFDLVAVMTRGSNGSQVLANFMYIQAFNNYRMGYGASIAVVLFAISLVFIIFYLSQVARGELEY